MKTLSPYLFFNGNCKTAMESYQKILGGDLKVVTVGDTDQEMFKDFDQNLVMHSLLKTPTFQIMASDNMKKDTVIGDSVCMSIECSSRAELDKLYAAFAKGGETSMEPQDTFWGAYFASVTDAFGHSWMFNFEQR